jgi:antitoxin component YwqK of YwqJK toxin-antitoxin module
LKYAEINYENEKRHGKSTYWDSQGKVQTVEHWENGSLIRTEKPNAGKTIGD